MLSTKNPASQESEYVTAYRYKSSLTGREYYVPSEKISFCQDWVIRDIETHRSTVMTKINLPRKLIEEIKKEFSQTDNLSLNISECAFAKTEEYKNLFDIKPRKPTMNFFMKVDTKGNNPLSKALVNYILDGALPAQTNLSAIMNRISKLDLIEQQSILQYIQVHLQTTNKQLEILHNDETNKLNQDITPKITTPLLSLIAGNAGLFIGKKMGSNAGELILGLLFATAVFGYGNYYVEDQYRQLDDDITAKEKRLNEVMTYLENSIKYAPKFDF